MKSRKELLISQQYKRDLTNFPLPEKEEGEKFNPQRDHCNNLSHRKSSASIKYIFQHHTHCDFQKSVEIFLTKSVSPHYLIPNKGDIIEEFVDIKYKAYHAGVGRLQENSKLNPMNMEKNDMNHWSIGIENVNNGNEPFSQDLIESNLMLCEKLCGEISTIDPKIMIGHSDWTPGRKIDPSPYFPWKQFANAKRIYEDSDLLITRNFGLFPREETLELFEEPEIIIENGNIRDSSSFSEKERIEKLIMIQKMLQEYGYYIPEEEIGSIGECTLKVLLSYNIHFKGKEILENKSDSWTNLLLDNTNINKINAIACFTENDITCLEDLLSQF